MTILGYMFNAKRLCLFGDRIEDLYVWCPIRTGVVKMEADLPHTLKVSSSPLGGPSICSEKICLIIFIPRYFLLLFMCLDVVKVEADLLLTLKVSSSPNGRPIHL